MISSALLLIAGGIFYRRLDYFRFMEYNVE
jgi:hypothetical protein